MPSSYPILTEDELYRAVRRELFSRRPDLRSGVSPDGHPDGCADGVGLELELFAILRNAYGARTAPVGEPGRRGATLMALFEAIAERGGWRLDAAGESIVLEGETGGRITLEPAGQIEYSGPPKRCAAEAVADLRAVAGSLAEGASELGIELVARGYNNLCDEEIPLRVTKPRYRAMDSHFAAIGPFGRLMMRATCSLQINLDFGAPSLTAERWRLANMIAPSLNAIFANSPHMHDGLRYRSFRHEIWRRADPARTGRLYDRPDLDPVADYLRFALDASVMMIRDDREGARLPASRLTFRQWLAGDAGHGYPDHEDWRLHLSTLFPDVRARGWMELRSIDALPAAWWGVPVAMTTALLYDDRLRREALALLERRHRHIHPAEHEHGGFWRSDYETGAELLALAIPSIADAGLAAQARSYREEFCAKGRVPADLCEGVVV